MQGSDPEGNGFPYVGDVLLAPAGSEVPTGYDNTVKTVPEADPSDPLAGLNIIWLGSSVTYGAQSGGHYSMADAIQDNHPELFARNTPSVPPLW